MFEAAKPIPFSAPLARNETQIGASDTQDARHKSDLSEDQNPYLSRHANDDIPLFPVEWHRTAQTLKSNTKTSLIFGVLIGMISIAFVNFAFSFFSRAQNQVENFTSFLLIGLIIAALCALAFVSERISRLANIITKTSEFEKNLNSSGRVAALSRELEAEASKIEARIENFLSVGAGLRMQLQREADTLNEVYSEKIGSLRSTIEDVDAARLAFLNEIEFVNNAIEIGKNFISAKIGSVTTDFEDAAMAATRVLETRLLDISEKIHMTISCDIVQKRNFERLVATNNSVIELLDSTPNLLNQHIANVSDVIDQGVRKKIDILNGKIEEISQLLVDKGENWIEGIQKTPDLIEKHLADANETIHSLLKSNQDNLDKQIHVATSTIREMNDKVLQSIQESPAAFEASLSSAIEKNMRFAKQEIEDFVKALADASANVAKLIEETPGQLDKIVHHLMPAFENGLIKNFSDAEEQITQFLNRQAQRVDQTVSETTRAISVAVEQFNNLNPKIAIELEAQVHGINKSINDATDAIEMQLSAFESRFATSKEKTIHDIKNVISGQISQIRTIMEQARLDTNNVIGRTISQQNVNLQEFEKRFEHLYAALAETKSHADEVKDQFAQSLQSQILLLQHSSAETLEAFRSLIAEGHGLINEAYVPNFDTINRAVEQECYKLENKLQNSLLKFYEIVKRCTETIEDASIRKLDGDLRRIEKGEDDTLHQEKKASDQDEFEKLTERLKIRIDAIKSSRDPS